MNQSFAPRLFSILIISSTLSLIGCEDESVWIIDMEISPTSIETTMGNPVEFRATVIWDDGHRGEDAAANWSTDNSSVATITEEVERDEQGEVIESWAVATPTGVGETQILAERAGDISATAVLIVTE